MEKEAVFVYALLALNLLLCAGETEREPLSIAAFNVQVFGRTKLSRPQVVGVLRQVRGPVFCRSHPRYAPSMVPKP